QVGQRAAQARVAAAQALPGAALARHVHHLHGGMQGAQSQDLPAAVARNADNADPLSARHREESIGGARPATPTRSALTRLGSRETQSSQELVLRRVGATRVTARTARRAKHCLRTIASGGSQPRTASERTRQSQRPRCLPLIISPAVCAQTAIDDTGAPPPGAPRRRPAITPIQYVGLAVLI